jgi:ribosomal protein S18 acetylase RimI-like enzyme
VNDAELHERMLDSMEAFLDQTCERAVKRDGLLAAITPSIPARSVFNSVVYRDEGAVRGSLGELERVYDDAGIVAWTVWVPRGDDGLADALESAGHELDASPEAMAVALAELDLDRGAEGLDWSYGPGGVPDMADILEEAFHWPAGPAARRFAWLEHVYVARADGEPAACVAALHHEGDCAIWNVGTREAARGRGLATGLMRQAMRDAREAGCETTSLQATALGRPVYERLGYRALGPLDMWERRRPGPPPT